MAVQTARDRSTAGVLLLFAVGGAVLMYVARGHWLLWTFALIATMVALGGLGYLIGKARE